ncbi:MAG: flavodoxin domain-containing protein [Desulfobacterales bacterium]|nr:flavodoxin domain-containing protein [Desulfobacterales bacterium]
MKPKEIKKGIFQVGVTDWNIRDFHGYSTESGTTYNAFLILDEKNVLIDTVKKEFSDQLIDNIKSIIPLEKIDIVISNHTEMDHSGSLPAVMHRVGENKPLYCSKMGEKNLSLHYQKNWQFHPVQPNETLNTGRYTLTFLETRMLHWPDSMFTYLNEEKILFSSDAFGQHYASQYLFDDQVEDKIMDYAKKYYANILLLYSPLVQKLLKQVTDIGLQINMICPDHGIIWRKDPNRIIKAYHQWSLQKPIKKAVLIYDTMWHSTETMAEHIVQGIADTGTEVIPMHLRKCHRSDIMTEVFDAKAIIIGSPTLNNGLYPTISDLITYMKGLKPKNKIGAAFGSYGWSGEAVALINQEFDAMKISRVDDGLKIQFVPDKKVLDQCSEYGQKIGQLIQKEDA